MNYIYIYLMVFEYVKRMREADYLVLSEQVAVSRTTSS